MKQVWPFSVFLCKSTGILVSVLNTRLHSSSPGWVSGSSHSLPSQSQLSPQASLTFIRCPLSCTGASCTVHCRELQTAAPCFSSTVCGVSLLCHLERDSRTYLGTSSKVTRKVLVCAHTMRGLSDLLSRPECGPQKSWLGRRASEQTELELGHTDCTKYEGTGLCVVCGFQVF